MFSLGGSRYSCAIIGTIIVFLAITFPAHDAVGQGIARSPEGDLSHLRYASPSGDCPNCLTALERAMRDYQARHLAVTRTLVEWPTAECGDGNKRPTPPFPPDGYFGDAKCDPRRAAALVDAMWQIMFEYRFIVVQKFTDKGGDDLVGVPDPSPDIALDWGQLTAGMPTLVDHTNYCSFFERIRDILEQMKAIEVVNVGGVPTTPGNQIDVLVMGNEGTVTHGGAPSGWLCPPELLITCAPTCEQAYAGISGLLAQGVVQVGPFYGVQEIEVREDLDIFPLQCTCAVPPGALDRCLADTLRRVRKPGYLGVESPLLRGEGFSLIALEGMDGWGTRTYPVKYTYDPQGRVKTLTTWQDFNETTGEGNAGAAVTTWNYSSTRGWLTQKLYNGQSTGPTYEYWPSGRLKKRTWTRNLYADYTYDHSGALVNINYDDSTPDVTYTFDRRGRATTIVDGVGARTLTYNDAGQMEVEDFGTGLLDPVRLENHFDSLLRRDWNKLFISNVLKNQVDIGYETISSRHRTVAKMGSTAGEYLAEYGYQQGSSAVQSVTMKRMVGGSPVTMATGVYDLDKLDRLMSLAWDSGAGPDESYTYSYNDANQRTRVEWIDGSRWDYVYDPMGQVTSAKRSWANPTPSPPTVPVAGQQFEFAYDDIGNRLSASLGGDSSGANLRSVSYSPNLLNQYTQRDVSSGVDVMGFAGAGVVTMTDGTTNQTAYRWGGGNFYQSLWFWANTVVAQHKQLNLLLDNTPFENRTVFIPKTPEVFTHDADGNLLSDGRWTYEWDGENRLKSMQTRTGMPAGLPVRRLEFTYDYMSRRIQKRVFQPTAAPPSGETDPGQDSGSGGVTGDTEGDDQSGNVAPWGWTELGTTKYVWDGWNLMAELTGACQPMRTYAWGLDLSGSEQGAGGIGGLLFETDWVLGTHGNPGQTHHAFYDGNGNLTSLRDNGGGEAAAYEYGPFGEILTTRGGYATLNPFRFSTKYADAESGLLYYGYRYLNTSTGRWLSRDPAEYADGPSDTAFVHNDSANQLDPHGLWSYVPNMGEFAGSFGPYKKRNQASFDSTAGESSLALTYKPNNKLFAAKCTKCNSIGFIQLYFTHKYGLGPLAFASLEKDKWTLDAGSPWYKDGTKGDPSKIASIRMDDNPGLKLEAQVGRSSRKSGMYQLFYTAVVCESGPAKGEVYGVLSWGHNWFQDTTGEAQRPFGWGWSRSVDGTQWGNITSLPTKTVTYTFPNGQTSTQSLGGRFLPATGSDTFDFQQIGGGAPAGPMEDILEQYFPTQRNEDR